MMVTAVRELDDFADGGLPASRKFDGHFLGDTPTLLCAENPS